MKKIIAKVMCMSIALVLLAVNFIGCGGTGSNVKKGRYVENEIKLPSDIKNYYIFQMEKSDKGLPVIYGSDKHANVKKEKSEKGIFKYTMKEDGTWDKESVSWLKDVIASHIYDSQIAFGYNGEEYFIYREENDEGMCGNINFLKKTGENSYKKINLDCFDETASYTPRITVLKSGNIAVDNEVTKNIYIYIYDKNSYKLIKQTSQDNYNKIYSYDDKYVLFDGDMDKGNTISIFDENAKKIKSIKFDKPKFDTSQSLRVLSDNSIILADGNGIHKLTKDTDIWQTIVDGSLTSLISPNLHSKDIIEDSNNNYYVIYATDNDNFKLMKYSYDKNVSSQPERQLSVYSLKENPTFELAVVEYQRKNPDVKVNYKYSIGLFDDDTNTNDYIKTFNTQLLAGKGADVIILDGLPVQSYIDKGVIQDITNFSKEVAGTNKLLANILDKCSVNGKQYYIPSNVGIETVFGDKDVVKNASNLNDLVKYSKAHPKKNIFGTITYEDLIKQFLPMHLNDFYTYEKGIDKDKLKKFLDDMKTISDNNGCLEQYEEDGEMSNEFDLASGKSKILLENCAGCFDSMGATSAVNLNNGSFASYNNMFTTFGDMAINSNMNNEDIAEDFIKEVLSIDVQSVDNVKGFPMSAEGLEYMKNCKDFGLINKFPIEKTDGTSVIFDIRWPDSKSMNKLLKMCADASNKTSEDNVIDASVIKQGTLYLKGQQDCEKTADNILNECKNYINEQK